MFLSTPTSDQMSFAEPWQKTSSRSMLLPTCETYDWSMESPTATERSATKEKLTEL